MQKHGLSSGKTVITATNKILKYHKIITKVFKNVSYELAGISNNTENKEKHELFGWKIFWNKSWPKDSVKFMRDEIDKIQQSETFIVT